MSLSSEEIKEHAKKILSLRDIKNRVIILCEGDISVVKSHGNSPASFKRLENFPDSNFYRSCLPKRKRQFNSPKFFNCGNRSDVIKVYFEIHNQYKKDYSYLDNFDKVYALIDLDIQTAKIDNYRFSSSEEIFYDLYHQLNIKNENILNHKIFVTGLIHKEAYFLLPNLKDIFVDYPNRLIYNLQDFNLNNLYQDIIKEINLDEDLKNHLNIACKRINFTDFNCTNIEALQNNFINNYSNDLIETLFLIAKAKPYWKKITNKDIDNERLREQLSMKIAEYISEQNDKNHHLIAIFSEIL